MTISDIPPPKPVLVPDFSLLPEKLSDEDIQHAYEAGLVADRYHRGMGAVRRAENVLSDRTDMVSTNPARSIKKPYPGTRVAYDAFTDFVAVLDASINHRLLSFLSGGHGTAVNGCCFFPTRPDNETVAKLKALADSVIETKAAHFAAHDVIIGDTRMLSCGSMRRMAAGYQDVWCFSLSLSLTLVMTRPVDVGALSPELQAMIKQGLDDVAAGRVKPLDWAKLREKGEPLSVTPLDWEKEEPLSEKAAADPEPAPKLMFRATVNDDGCIFRVYFHANDLSHAVTVAEELTMFHQGWCSVAEVTRVEAWRHDDVDAKDLNKFHRWSSS